MLIQTIHIVEDDGFFAELIQLKIKQHFPEIKVSHFFSGEELLEQEVPADLLILDYDLNSETGHEHITGLQLKNQLDENGDKTPTIFLTGMQDIHDAVFMMENHASDFIIKDKTSLDKLVKTIKDVDDIIALDKEKKSIITTSNDHRTGWKLVAVALAILLIFVLLF